PAAAVQQDTCTGPPPPAPVQNLDGVPWSTLQPYVDSLNFELGISAAVPVRLCETCRVMVIRIESERRTPCLGKAALNGQPRIVGRLTKLNPFAYESAIGFGTDNFDRRVYLVAQGDSTGYGVYRDLTDTARVVRQSQATGLFFRFCPDGHNSKRPEAWYRPRTQADSIPEDDEEEELQYGWMACASGCCRFYGSPPPPPPPPQYRPRPRPSRPSRPGQSSRTPAPQVDPVCAMDTLPGGGAAALARAMAGGRGRH
ncbi:MAG TPA: hypothetical protein VF746_28955, partial [Longimicrobium sp.]